MLPDVEDTKMATTVATKLRAALGVPYVIGDLEIRMSASTGSVVYPDDGESSVALFRAADSALYRAKTTNAKVSITKLPVRSRERVSMTLRHRCRGV